MIAHVPVLLEEVMTLLAVQENGTYVDGTAGLGGHAERILSLLGPSGRLIVVDRDRETLDRVRERLGEDRRLIAEHGNFSTIREIARRHGLESVDGVLLDLGVSMAQLADEERGFSFRSPAPLDMRMDRSTGPTAADLVNRMPERELANVIFTFGDERKSRRIAKAIVRARPLRTCDELARVIERVMPRGRARIHPATRTFQALRIAVNEELDVLGGALEGAAETLGTGGRLCVIAYHSLEDRIVKESFRAMKQRGFEVLTKKPVRPTDEEIVRNRAARSARLRAIRRGEARAHYGEDAA